MSFKVYQDRNLDNLSNRLSLQLPQIDITLIPPSAFAPLPRGKMVIHTDNNLYYSDGIVWIQIATGFSGIWEHVAGVAPSGNYVRIDATNPDFDGAESLLFGQQAFDPATGSRMMFDQPNGAFRAGTTTGNQWDSINRGVDSAAFGTDCIASGQSSFAAGLNNVALGLAGVCFGSSNTSNGTASSILGGGSNLITSDNAGIVSGSAVTVSGNNSAVLSGITQVVTADTSAIVAGRTNTVTAENSAVVAGRRNTVSGESSAIVCGSGHFVFGPLSTIVCGEDNIIGLNSSQSMIGGGDTNLIDNGLNTSILSGTFNSILNASQNSAIVAGTSNIIDSANNSVIPGGTSNTCTGNTCFVAGNTASDAGQDNCFVWGDSNGATVGVGTGALPATANQWYVKSSGGTTFYSDAAASTGVQLAPGGVAWAAVCQRSNKRNITELDYSETLKRVDELKVYDFVYKSENDDHKKYRGPMAEEWHSLFPSSKDSSRIDTLDLDGIAFAAVKGLLEKVKELEIMVKQQGDLIKELQV